jgi:hypothetical protein
VEALLVMTSFALDDADPDDSDGVNQSITFTLPPGTYEITESLPSGWQLDDATCVGASGSVSLSGETLSVAVGAGEDVVCTFTNTLQSGDVTIHKFHDANRNGIQDAGEEDIAGWTMRIYVYIPGGTPILLAEGVTDGQGNAHFDDLEPGLYKAWESGRTCWKAVEYDNTLDGGFYKAFELEAGEDEYVEFGNYNFCEPDFSIDVEKYVSVDNQTTWHDADLPPGPVVLAGNGTVWFKFIVTNGDGTLTNITLGDTDFDAEIASQCTLPTELDTDESFECVIGPFVAVEGQHVNTATVTGDHGGQTYSDTDRAKYYGVPGPVAYPSTGVARYASVGD